MPAPRSVFVAVLVAPLCASHASAATLTEQQRVALLIDGQRLSGPMLGLEYDAKSPATCSGQIGSASFGEGSLVRWGQPFAAKRPITLTLTDGSRLTAAEDWASKSKILADAQSVSIRRGRRWFRVPRASVARLRFTGELGPFAAGAESTEDDQITLVGPSPTEPGDEFRGRLLSINEDRVAFEIAGVETPFGVDEVEEIRLANPVPDEPGGPACLVGLTDGSLLRARTVRVEAGAAKLATTAGVRLTVTDRQLALVQPLGGRVRYLSDEAPLDYRHTPYFDLAWPLGRDTTPLGGPLVAGGVRYVKGLSVHSAARVVFRLREGDQRFQASLAIADSREARGSVVFRVYLVRGAAPEAAYESAVIRAGDPSTSVDVDVSGAVGLVLIVDYADGGDAGDDALWLDARVVMAGPKAAG